MEFTIRVPELAKALSRVQGIVEKKTTMPILANVLIAAKGRDAVTVSATDLEIGLTASYEAKITKPGGMTLDAKALFDIVRSLPEQTVTLKSTANHHVEITCGKVKYRVLGMPPENFPSLPKFADVPFFVIDPKTFREMIEKSVYATSTDETRYNLTGVYCEAIVGTDGLRMVATDGHRLSLVERPTPSKPVMRDAVIIPRKGLLEAKKLLDGAEGEARLGIVDNSAVFEKADVTLTVRLVDGKFPDYQQVIPTASAKRVVIERHALLAALKRVSLLSPDKSQGVRIDLLPEAIAVSSNNPDAGEAREEVDAEVSGDAMKIGLNFRYVTDALAVLTDEKVTLELTDELSPVVVLGVGSEGFRAVIMPQRI